MTTEATTPRTWTDAKRGYTHRIWRPGGDNLVIDVEVDAYNFARVQVSSSDHAKDGAGLVLFGAAQLRQVSAALNVTADWLDAGGNVAPDGLPVPANPTSLDAVLLQQHEAHRQQADSLRRWIAVWVIFAIMLAVALLGMIVT